MGDVLEVDLSSGRCARRRYNAHLAHLLLAGSGLCSYELWRAVESEGDPTAPGDPLVFSCGMLAATVAPCSDRVTVSAVSPLTGLGGHSNVGGRAGAALRRAGLQGVVVRGEAPLPVVLHIGADEDRLIDAADLWGMETGEAARVLAARSPARGKGPAMLLIGPGGEHRVRYASIMSPGGHAAGRTGMGAVMGAKQLKAIVIDGGSSDAPVTDAAREAAKHYLRSIVESANYPFWAHYGSGTVKEASDLGFLTTRNFKQSTFEHAEAMDTANLDRSVVRRVGCPRCPIHCKAEMILTTGAHAGEHAHRPEFETLCMWGARLGIGGGDDVVHLAALCDALGIDTDSTAAAVAFAIDLFERRLIDISDTDGLRLAWGDVPSIETLVKRIAVRRGFGDVLADGVRAAALRIGRGSEDFAYHVKGLEIPCYDPRSSSSTALAYSVMNRGADYASAFVRHEDDCTPEQAERLYGDVAVTDRHVPAGKASMVWRGTVVGAALDALGICKFPALSLLNEYDLEAEAQLAGAIAGVPISAQELFDVGERIVTLDRYVNARLGATAADDRLPALFVETPLRDGPGAGQTAQVADTLQEYYALMGWSADGVPTEATLRRLGIADIPDFL